MNEFEKATIIGMYRSGATFELIAAHFGISSGYVEQIINEYINKKKK